MSVCVEGVSRFMAPTACSAFVPVGARADMPCRVQGAAAERARWPAGGHDFGAPTCERTGSGRLDHYAQDRLEDPRLLRLQRGLAFLIDHQLLLAVMALHDDDPTLGIPPKAHRADSELVLDGCGQRVVVLE